nr:immunoglobulin heavy chain junction region [Mus musculus]
CAKKTSGPRGYYAMDYW